MKRLLPLIPITFLLSGCGSKGILGDIFNILPEKIDSVEGFLYALFTLLVVIIVLFLLGSLVLGRAAHAIVIVALFVAILIFRDYGFFMTLLLFIFEWLALSGISVLINLIKGRTRSN